MNRKAIIFGIKGYALTKKEKILIKSVKPWGIILFSRNIKNIIQVKILTKSIRNILNDEKYPILIDEEGGKVSRLKNIIDLSHFSQKFFTNLYNRDKKFFFIIYKIYINKLCDLFKDIGININTVPVLDVFRKSSHDIIGTRSFSEKSYLVYKLGKICLNFYKKNKIATVIKHIPGHGMSNRDSHYKTPITNLNKKDLIKKDFKTFKNSESLFAMTAHIIYSAYDSKNTATHSKIVIKKVIRKHINFNGILISDDISMKSLTKNIEKNAILALKAGCNLVLHCNANLSEMKKLSKVVPKIDSFTQKKTSHFYKFLM